MINRGIAEEQAEIRRQPTENLRRYAEQGTGMTGILAAMELSRRAQMGRAAAGAAIANRHRGTTVLHDLARDAAALVPAPQQPVYANQGGVVQHYQAGAYPVSGSYSMNSPYLDAIGERRRRELERELLEQQALINQQNQSSAAGPILDYLAQVEARRRSGLPDQGIMSGFSGRYEGGRRGKIPTGYGESQYDRWLASGEEGGAALRESIENKLSTLLEHRGPSLPELIMDRNFRENMKGIGSTLLEHRGPSLPELIMDRNFRENMKGIGSTLVNNLPNPPSLPSRNVPVVSSRSLPSGTGPTSPPVKQRILPLGQPMSVGQGAPPMARRGVITAESDDYDPRSRYEWLIDQRRRIQAGEALQKQFTATDELINSLPRTLTRAEYAVMMNLPEDQREDYVTGLPGIGKRRVPSIISDPTGLVAEALASEEALSSEGLPADTSSLGQGLPPKPKVEKPKKKKKDETPIDIPIAAPVAQEESTKTTFGLTKDREQYAKGLALLQAAARIASGGGNELANITAGLAEGGQSYQGYLDRSQQQSNVKAAADLRRRQIDLQKEAIDQRWKIAQFESDAAKDRLLAQLQQANRSDQARLLGSVIGTMQDELQAADRFYSGLDPYVLQQYGEGVTAEDLSAQEKKRIRNRYRDLLRYLQQGGIEFVRTIEE